LPVVNPAAVNSAAVKRYCVLAPSHPFVYGLIPFAVPVPVPVPIVAGPEAA